MSQRPFALYARKSSEEDERQAQSLESQDRAGQRVALRLGVAVEVIEDAHSAKEPGRPVFDAMIARIDKGEFGGLIAWHPDRLSRNEIDAAAITYRLRKGILPELHFDSYQFQNSNEGIMMLQHALSMSQYQSSKLVTDVTRGMTEKIEKGWYPHCAPPGYLNNKHMDKGDKTISPDPDYFPIVRRIFDYFLTGAYSGKALLKLINEDWGYRSRMTRRQGGAPMSKSTLYRLLSNVFYAGCFYTRGHVFEGKHEKMITLQEYHRVQEILGNVPRIQSQKREFAYTGLIKCRHCGYSITAQVTTNRHGQEYSYYRCTHCTGHNLNETVLQKQIDARVERIGVIPDFADWADEENKKFQATTLAADHAIYTQKLSTLGAIETRLNNLLTALTKGLIGDAEYLEHKNRLQHERLQLQEETREQTLAADRAREAMENLAVFVRNLKDWMQYGDLPMKRACLRQLGSNILLDGKNVLLDLHPLLVDIDRGYKALETKYLEIKHDETLSESTKNELIEPIRSAWSDMWARNQTLALDQGLSFPKLCSPGVSLQTPVPGGA
jgi:site-specific DNA recombinase